MELARGIKPGGELADVTAPLNKTRTITVWVQAANFPSNPRSTDVFEFRLTGSTILIYNQHSLLNFGKFQHHVYCLA
jgi:hypothetical protein